MVREGYKETEFGEIPEDWKVVELSKISESYSGGTPSRDNPTFYERNIP
ncbi:MAG: hypothetical protein KAW93_04365 [Methanogenium sp.]|nr:hypothetical protein [Methanogenium sp.]